MTDPFAPQARQYLLSRPVYPEELLTKFYRSVPNIRTSTCLDLCCGSGQLTTALAEQFSQVLGVDRSVEQLKNSKKHPKVVYSAIKDASDLSEFSSESWDCVTIAQGLHWLPLEKTLNEVYRVLKPQGVFATFGYGICSIMDQPKAQKKFRDYYENTLGSLLPPENPKCMWDCSRIRLDSGHASESFTPPFQTMRRTWQREPKTVTIVEFLDYLSTFSAFQNIKKTIEDPLKDIREALNESGKKEIQIVYPFFLILCTKQPSQNSSSKL